MAVRQLVFTILFASFCFALSAQTDAKMTATSGYRSFSPADQYELGIGVGPAFIVGDLDPKLGFGAGLHLRKSLDHIFSLRGVLNFAKTHSESANSGSTPNSEADMTWLSGGLQVVASLNNFRFNKPNRKWLINAFFGLGVDKFKTDYKSIKRDANGYQDGTVDEGANGYIDFGGELSWRLSPKMNISLRHTLYSSFGAGADELDGDFNYGNPHTTYRDNLHHTMITLNFNLGKMAKNGSMRSEPLYWVNPMAMVSDAVQALEARPVYDPTDTDKDGVIDAIDQEKESPDGARVDSRGVTLDSDSDGVADYKDKEPYSPPGYKVDAVGVAQVPKEHILSEAEVNKMIDAKLANFKLPTQKGLVDWFLPMIHFDLDRYDINRSEYEKLYHVATVLKQNPELKVAVIGHTDRSASNRYNNVLSYNRAKAAIDFLVGKYGIDRSRLVLTWGGEDTALVATNSANYINRRVEFKVATSETEMGRPEGPNAGHGGRFSGNKDAGY